MRRLRWLAQVTAATGALVLTGIFLFDLTVPIALAAGASLVLSSTAVVMSVLQDRGEVSSAEGQKSVSILLFEDLMIVPLLGVVAFLSPLSQGENGWTDVLMALAALWLLLGVSCCGINPLLALLAKARTREVLTAGALLVALCAALLMDAVGLSMAMGAFLAGVMLSTSSYRHQIETDIEPFRGLLMGLFFLAVGMALDFSVVEAEWPLLVSMLAAFTVVKGGVVYTIAQMFGASNQQALHRTSMFLQGGEFAFVLYAAVMSGGVINARENVLLTTVVILSMAVKPLLMLAADRLLRTRASMDGVEIAHDLKGRILLIRFGRFGQIVSQMLLSKGITLTDRYRP